MRVEARVLGSFRLAIDGRVVDPSAFERPSGLRLLKLLLVTPGHRLPREVAAERLTPEAAPERSRVSLRKAIHFARRALEAHGLPPRVIGGGMALVELDAAAAVEVDVDVTGLRVAIEEVLGAAAAGLVPPTTALESLARLGGVDLLADEPYDEAWLSLRERLHRQSVEALLVGIGTARRGGHGPLALRLVDRLLQLEPAEEAAHRHAIELHVEAGRLDAARRQLVACAAALAVAYDIEPSPELQALLTAPPRPEVAIASAQGVGAALVEALVETVVALRASGLGGVPPDEARAVRNARSSFALLQP